MDYSTATGTTSFGNNFVVSTFLNPTLYNISIDYCYRITYSLYHFEGQKSSVDFLVSLCYNRSNEY